MNNYSEAPQVIRNFLSYMETIGGKSRNTTLEYFYDLRTFFRFLKVLRRLVDKDVEFEQILINDIDIEFIKTITLSDLYDFMTYVNHERNNNASSRARKIACLKSFFKYLNIKAKLIDDNPAKELDTPKILRQMPKYLSLEESKSLLKVVDGEFKDRDYAILVLFLNCGLRLSELVSININKIKYDTLTIMGKGGKERTVYLNKACIKAVNRYLEYSRPHEGVKDKNALFLSKRKQRISSKTVQHMVKKYLKLAGLDTERYSVHKLRHTAATLMYKHGQVDIRALQEILGHEHISTTEIYTHVDSDKLRSAVDANPLSDIEDD
jgi:site-specific recombinase XerD